MTSRAKRVYPTGAAAYLTTSLADMYTALAGERFYIDKVTVANHNAASRTVTLQIIPAGQVASNAYRIVYIEDVAGNDSIDFPQLKHVLNPGDSLQAMASAGSSLAVFVSGRSFS